MRTEPLFKAGDVAVLRNERGGRVFTVHTVAGERITEVAWAEHQQPYALEVWTDQPVAVRDRAAADVLVGLLEAAHERYTAKRRTLIAIERQEFDALYREHDHRRG